MQPKQLMITRNGNFASEYYPNVYKQYAMTVFKTISGYLKSRGYDAGMFVVNGLTDTYTDIRRLIILDMMDYKYGTALRKQYLSGVRTQKILKTKRDFGLI